MQAFHSKVDTNARVWLTFLTIQRWLGIRLDLITTLLTTLTAVLCVYFRHAFPPHVTGLALVYVITTNACFQWLIRQVSSDSPVEARN